MGRSGKFASLKAYDTLSAGAQGAQQT